MSSRRSIAFLSPAAQNMAAALLASAVVQAPAPERLIRAGLPTEALVAHVLVSKYAWHLPLYSLDRLK